MLPYGNGSFLNDGYHDPTAALTAWADASPIAATTLFEITGRIDPFALTAMAVSGPFATFTLNGSTLLCFLAIAHIILYQFSKRTIIKIDEVTRPL